MNKKKKWLIVLSAALATLVVAGACCLMFFGENETNKVRFAELIPDAVLGEEYNFEPYFEKEEKTTYVMTAEYMGDDFEWHALETNGFKFTQNVFADVHITITATKGKLTYKGETNVGVMTTPDDMDQWMVNIWGGEGVKKTLNYDEAYFSVKDSLSSVKVDYMGTAVKGSAISVFPLTDWPNNERLSVENWENAVLTFDVYNTSDKDITFGFLIRHHELGINTNFGTNTQYVAKPNEWTKVAVSLRSFGVTQKPIFDADFELSDYIVMQMTYDGATEDESGYVFGLYADNIDIVDYDEEKFPDLDTTLNYEFKDFFTNDDALSVYYNGNKIEKDQFTSTDVASTESVKSIKALYSKDGSSTTGMVHSFIGGNPTGWKPLDISNAVITFDVKCDNADKKFIVRFESDYNVFSRDLEFDLDKKSGTGWTSEALSDGWYRITLKVAESQMDSPFVRSDFVRCMRFYFTNETASKGKESVVYLDNLHMTGHEVTKYDLNEESPWDTKSPYTAAEENDMFSTDDALAIYIDDEKMENVMVNAADINVYSVDSLLSFKVQLSKNGSPSTGMVHSFIGGNPTGWKPLDISNAVISFDVKCNNADKKFIVRFESDYNVFSRDIVFDLNKKSGTGWTSKALSDGWYRITLNVAKSEISSPFVRPDFIRCMRFYFTNETASKGKESAIYLDNLHMTGHKTTKYKLNEESPWDTQSPYTAAEANDMFSTDDALAIYIGEEKVENVMVNAADIDEYSKDSFLSFEAVLSKDGSSSTAMVHSFIGGNPTGWKPLDLTKATVSFDVKPSNIDKEFVLKFEADYGSYSKELKLKAEDNASGKGWKSEKLGDGWYRITINVAKLDINSDTVHTDFVRCMRLFFTNESAKAGKESVVHFDNLTVTNYKTTPHKLNASDPWNTPSPYKKGNEDGGEETGKELPESEKNDLTNLTSELGTMSSVAIDTEHSYGDSIQSLQLVQDKKTEEKIQWAAVFIAELNDWKGVDISGNAICFDMKAENYANWFGVSIEHTEKSVSEGVYFTPSAGSNGYGYECIELDSGWIRVYVYPDMLWSEYTNSVFKIMFTLNKEGADVSKDSVVNIDNLHLVSGSEEDDAITAYVNCEDESLDVLTFDHDIHRTDSLRSLKLGIAANRGETWGNADVYISELNDWKAVDLGGKTITMEIKPVNTPDYFGIAVERTGQGLSDMIYVGLNSSDDEKGWKCSALSDGWYSVQIDVDKAFGGYQDKVFKIRILTTNSGMDYSTATAFYIDRLYLGAKFSELTEAVLSEEGDYIYADKVKVDGVLDVVDEETSITAPYSQKAMKMGISAGRGEVWGCADVVMTSLAEGNNITLTGKTITFDMKLDNALNSIGVTINTPGVGFAEWIWLNSDGSGEGWASEAIGGGWYRFNLDMDKCFGNHASCVSQIRYMISNSGQNQEAATNVYIDNLYLDEIIVNMASENADAIHTNLINVDDMLSTFDYSNTKLGTNSLSSLKMSIAAERGETWVCGDIVIGAFNQWSAIDLNGKTISFEVYAENMPTYFGLHIGDSLGGVSDAIWIGLDSKDDAQGWACQSIGNGWYSVTVEVDKAFAAYKSKAFKLRFMVTNSGKDYSADMAMYIDNLDLGIPLSELAGQAIASEEDDAIKTNAQNVDSVLNTLTYDEEVVSANSTKSLKLGINAGRGETWANADIYISELIDWKPVDLGGKIISFDVKPVNNTPYFGFAIERSDVGLAEMIYVGFNSYDTAKGWSCQEIGNGWYKAIIDLDKAFGGYQDRVFKFRVLISNSGQNYNSDTAVYLDNLYLGTPISELTEGVRTEGNDAINVDCQDGGNLNVIEYSTEQFSLYSERSLKLGINGGRGEVWASGDILIAALNQWNGVDLSGKTVEFDVKPVNSQNFFALATEQQGVGLAEFIWIGFDSADEAQGWSCRPTGAGWYHVTVDVEKAFPNYTTSVFKFRVMINNQNQDQAKETTVYIDNLKWN